MEIRGVLVRCEIVCQGVRDIARSILMSAINHSEHPIFAARDAEFHDILLKPLRFGCKTPEFRIKERAWNERCRKLTEPDFQQWLDRRASSRTFAYLAVEGHPQLHLYRVPGIEIST